VKIGAKVIVLPQTLEARRPADRQAQTEPAAMPRAQVSYNGLAARGVY
jgi:hypothetical protein